MDETDTLGLSHTPDPYDSTGLRAPSTPVEGVLGITSTHVPCHSEGSLPLVSPGHPQKYRYCLHPFPLVPSPCRTRFRTSVTVPVGRYDVPEREGLGGLSLGRGKGENGWERTPVCSPTPERGYDGRPPPTTLREVDEGQPAVTLLPDGTLGGRVPRPGTHDGQVPAADAETPPRGPGVTVAGDTVDLGNDVTHGVPVAVGGVPTVVETVVANTNLTVEGPLR